MQNSVRKLSSFLAVNGRRNNRVALQAFSFNHVRNTHIMKHYKPQELLDYAPDRPVHSDTWHKTSDPDHIYKHLYDTNTIKSEPIDVLLLTTVEDIGNIGDIVTLKPATARKHLLLPKLAVYASPENIEKYKDLKLLNTAELPSSFHAVKTMAHIGAQILWLNMNLDEPWELQPWHARIGLRNMGIVCPDEAIQLPSQPIRGPNLDIQHKVFAIKVTINNKEQVFVRALIHHVTSDIMRKLPLPELDFSQPLPALFPEEEEYFEALHEQWPPFTKWNRKPQLTYEQFKQTAKS